MTRLERIRTKNSTHIIYLNICRLGYEESFDERLVKDNWRIVYQDSVSVVYQK